MPRYHEHATLADNRTGVYIPKTQLLRGNTTSDQRCILQNRTTCISHPTTLTMLMRSARLVYFRSIPRSCASVTSYTVTEGKPQCARQSQVRWLRSVGQSGVALRVRGSCRPSFRQLAPGCEAFQSGRPFQSRRRPVQRMSVTGLFAGARYVQVAT